MAPNISDIERAVARTLRDSLEKLQHTSDEVSQAVGDLVAACGSARPSNALPHLVRAQTAAASLAASMDVLSRFITGALQPGWNAARSESQASREVVRSSADNNENEQFNGEEVDSSDSVAFAANSTETEAPLVDSTPAEHVELVAGVEGEGSFIKFAGSPVSVEHSQSAAENVEGLPEVASSTAEFDEPAAEVSDLPLEITEFESNIPEPLGAAPVPSLESFEFAAKSPEPAIEMQPSACEHLSAASEFEPAAEEVASTLQTVVSETAAAETNTAEAVAGGAAIHEAPVAQEFAAEPVTSFAIPATPFSIPALPNQPLPSEPAIQPPAAAEHPMFDVAALPTEQQELHRRANRVAKVTMQDIKMLRPRDVELGKQNHDLCTRLRDDIERAHKEYERRFHAIMEHPVDYFHVWMVEILADGEARALGQYPYRSPVLQR